MGSEWFEIYQRNLIRLLTVEMIEREQRKREGSAQSGVFRSVSSGAHNAFGTRTATHFAVAKGD
jgi:hypothetical protein